MASNPNTDLDKLISFGQMALEQGWYDKAREYFQQALKLAPSNREAMKGLARVNEILSRSRPMPVEPTRAEPVKPRPKVVTTNKVAYGLAAVLVLAVVVTLVWIAYGMFIEPRREVAVAPTAVAISIETPKPTSTSRPPTVMPIPPTATLRPTVTLIPPTPIPPRPTLNPTMTKLVLMVTVRPSPTTTAPPKHGFTPTPVVADCHPGRNITYPTVGAVLDGIVEIRGSANIQGFSYYRLEFRQEGKSEWIRTQQFEEPVIDGILGIWDTSSLPAGIYRLRLIVVYGKGSYYEPCQVEVVIDHGK
jgi:hypothetical protein